MPNTNQIEIKSLINKWVASIQSKDMKGILRDHSSDILMFDVSEPLQSKGLKEYQKTWELFFSIQQWWS